MDKEKKLCVKLLEGFKITEKIKPSELGNFRIRKSQLYGLGDVYMFNYKKNRYYVVDDYSLGDEPKYVKNILLEINQLLKGSILKSPVQFTSEGSEYIYGMDGHQYYLWEEPRVSAESL